MFLLGGDNLMHKVGSKVFIVSNGYRILSGIVKNYHSNFYTLCLEDGSSTRLRSSKVFDSMEQAEKTLKNQVFVPAKPKSTPYDYM